VSRGRRRSERHELASEMEGSGSGGGGVGRADSDQTPEPRTACAAVRAQEMLTAFRC